MLFPLRPGKVRDRNGMKPLSPSNNGIDFHSVMSMEILEQEGYIDAHNPEVLYYKNKRKTNCICIYILFYYPRQKKKKYENTLVHIFGFGFYAFLQMTILVHRSPLLLIFCFLFIFQIGGSHLLG